MLERTKQVMEFYDQLAFNYEELYGEEQREKWFTLLEELINYLNNSREKKLVIFDLGCGVGFNDLFFLKKIKGRKIKLFGLDLSFNSLKINKNKNIYDFLINCDLNNFCFKKIENNKRNILISCSSLQNLEEESVLRILSLKNMQIHSVMYKSKGEKYWKNLFKNKGFKFIKKVRNDLLFSRI
jgi:predicted TPR repeat methyltransferase